MQKHDGDSIKGIGVYRGCHYYYDGRHNQFFLLTPNFRITRQPKHFHDPEIVTWCKNQKEKFLKAIVK